MPSSPLEYVLVGIRVILVAGGLLFAAQSVYNLATLPPPPPGSEGFATGMAYLIGSVIFVLALGAICLGMVLPTVLGVGDPLGFNRWQRLLLKAAAALIGGGFLLGVLAGFATEFQYGFIFWLIMIILSVVVVCVAVGWRLVEVAMTTTLRIMNNIA